MQIGLFFGSFNPIHIGHQIIADQILEAAQLDEVWMMVSPQNPFKKKDSLLNQYDRFHLIELATENHPKIRPSNFEFNLPVPSYTIDTLTHLREKYAKHSFSLLMGSDNLEGFHKWKNYEQILQHCEILVYARPNTIIENEWKENPKVRIFHFPQMDVSSSFLRKQIKAEKSVKYFLDHRVEAYIKDSNFYK